MMPDTPPRTPEPVRPTSDRLEADRADGLASIGSSLAPVMAAIPDRYSGSPIKLDCGVDFEGEDEDTFLKLRGLLQNVLL
jgi:hypothetical protein